MALFFAQLFGLKPREETSDLGDEQLEELRMLSGFKIPEIKRLRREFLRVTEGSDRITLEAFYRIPWMAVNPLQDRIAAIFGFPNLDTYGLTVLNPALKKLDSGESTTDDAAAPAGGAAGAAEAKEGTSDAVGEGKGDEGQADKPAALSVSGKGNSARDVTKPGVGGDGAADGKEARKSRKKSVKESGKDASSSRKDEAKDDSGSDSDDDNDNDGDAGTSSKKRKGKTAAGADETKAADGDADDVDSEDEEEEEEEEEEAEPLESSVDFPTFLKGVAVFNTPGRVEEKLRVAFRMHDFDGDGTPPTHLLSSLSSRLSPLSLSPLSLSPLSPTYLRRAGRSPFHFARLLCWIGPSFACPRRHLSRGHGQVRAPRHRREIRPRGGC